MGEEMSASGNTTTTSNRLINIDNGGTLTDFCVIDADQTYRTKSVTTPYDLSKCLFDGLRKVSRQIYGEEDLQSLLLSADHIRYSTTQGTNSLVERKGPRLGLVVGGGIDAEQLRSDNSLFADLVGERVVSLPGSCDNEAGEAAAVKAVSELLSTGANRIVVAMGGATGSSEEIALKHLLLRRFPPHFLGAIPLLFSYELAEDGDDERRTWTALFNAFLHPAMERFLYSAEQKLREHKARNPLLIFRNDGQSGRVARTTAIRTYSSGPRGGLEGAKALAAHYDFPRLLTMDIGGTTTDIGLVERNDVRSCRYGRVEDVETSFSLCDIVSSGVGGSSIIKANGNGIAVGPESVGGEPGPACFGLGGQEATITDAFLVLGLLDAAAYFGGELNIDAERAKAAVMNKVGNDKGLADVDAAAAMEAAWVTKVAEGLRQYAEMTPDTTLAAFGGAGPFVVCKVAEALGINQVVIPGMAAVFSAFGIGFSDIGHCYEATLTSHDDAALKDALQSLNEKARRGMFGEGFELAECSIEQSLRVISNGAEVVHALVGEQLPADLASAEQIIVSVNVSKPIPHCEMQGRFSQQTGAAQSNSTRRVYVDGDWQDLPVYRMSDQPATAVAAEGPAVLEEDFFTCRIDADWRFEINEARDVLLQRV